MADKDKLKAPESADRLPTIEFKIPDMMPVLSSDIFVSQNSIEKGLFYLTFFQSRPPIFTETEGVSPPDKIAAECIVRLALTPQVTLSLIQTLQRNFERFQEMVQNKIAKAETGSKRPRGNTKQ